MSDTTKPDGGPAFPIWTEDMPVEGSSGISVRDYFAGQALGAFLSGKLHNVRDGDTLDAVGYKVAAACYAMADAMLQERDR